MVYRVVSPTPRPGPTTQFTLQSTDTIRQLTNKTNRQTGRPHNTTHHRHHPQIISQGNSLRFPSPGPEHRKTSEAPMKMTLLTTTVATQLYPNTIESLGLAFPKHTPTRILYVVHRSCRQYVSWIVLVTLSNYAPMLSQSPIILRTKKRIIIFSTLCMAIHIQYLAGSQDKCEGRYMPSSDFTEWLFPPHFFFLMGSWHHQKSRPRNTIPIKNYQNMFIDLYRW